MKKIIVIAIIGLFLGVAVAPSINADVKEQDVELKVNELKLQEQRLIELVEGIFAYYEQRYEATPTVDEDCRCEEQTTGLWPFPVICLLLYPLLIISFGLLRIFRISQPFITMVTIGAALNCFWFYY